MATKDSGSLWSLPHKTTSLNSFLQPSPDQLSQTGGVGPSCDLINTSDDPNTPTCLKTATLGFLCCSPKLNRLLPFNSLLSSSQSSAVGLVCR